MGDGKPRSGRGQPRKRGSKQPRSKPSLPSRDEVLKFIEQSDKPAGKREIARAFNLRGQDKIALKALLKDMANDGLIDSEPGRAFQKAGGVPSVTVLKIVEIDGREAVAVPERWQAQGKPPPRIRVKERGRRAALDVGDRILARTEKTGEGYSAHLMKKLVASDDMLMGVLEKDAKDKFWLAPIDKKKRHRTAVTDTGEGGEGDLVLAEPSGRGAQQKAKVREVLGDPLAPRSFSLIAIAKYDIPNRLPDAVVEEADTVAELPIATDGRVDLRALPFVAIDPADARDHDDAIWAERDTDMSNAGGFRAAVAIADVSYYVRPGSALDREAYKRGNSVYFPDRVVPMLPEKLSADICSLKQDVDRAAMVCHLTIDREGRVKSQRFERAVIRLAGNIAYEDAQAAIDGGLQSPMLETALKALWDCWDRLFAAREDREPLDLDIPERRVVLDDEGHIVEVAVHERLDAHRLVEDFMIAANVAAAKQLEAKASPLIYRVHEPPSREKLVALRDYVGTFDLQLALGQVVRPALFNRLLEKAGDDDTRQLVREQVLRSQSQAVYSPVNGGHFGLSLGSYAHFTSPIRRYADLVVHRALVRACKLEQPAPDDQSIPPKSGLNDEQAGRLDVIAETISNHERRAMMAERETLDRYVAAHLSARTGETLRCRITGVQKFGFFATVEGFGGDGLVPVRTLGSEYFVYDEDAQTLTGSDSGTRYEVGMKLDLELVEANPISGGLIFGVPDDADRPSGDRKSGDGKKRKRPVRRGGRKPRKKR